VNVNSRAVIFATLAFTEVLAETRVELCRPTRLPPQARVRDVRASLNSPNTPAIQRPWHTLTRNVHSHAIQGTSSAARLACRHRAATRQLQTRNWSLAQVIQPAYPVISDARQDIEEILHPSQRNVIFACLVRPLPQDQLLVHSALWERKAMHQGSQSALNVLPAHTPLQGPQRVPLAILGQATIWKGSHHAATFAPLVSIQWQGH